MGISPSVQTFFSIGCIQLHGWDEWDVHMLQECSQIIIQLKYPVNDTKITEILVVVLAHSVLAIMTKNHQELVVQCAQRWSGQNWVADTFQAVSVALHYVSLNAELKREKQGENRKYVKT